MTTTNDPVYRLVCANLGRIPETLPESVRDNILQVIDAAESRLAMAGTPVNNEDAVARELWVMYALYLYRHKDGSEEMPRSLRLAINDAKVYGLGAEE